MAGPKNTFEGTIDDSQVSSCQKPRQNADQGCQSDASSGQGCHVAEHVPAEADLERVADKLLRVATPFNG